MNLYRGCAHGCVYCDSRSTRCRFTHPYEDIEVRQNAPELLEDIMQRGHTGMKKTIDELLQAPYWVIDILPKQVPKDSPGQYFAVERYYLAEAQFAAIKQKHTNVILKLNCYRDLSLNDDPAVNPPPEQIAAQMRRSILCIMVDDSMILSEPDDTHMTLFNPDEQLLKLIQTISAGEGLFVWKP